MATISVGQVMTLGQGRFAARAVAMASMSPGWSLPKLANRYSTPASTRASRMAELAVYMAATLNAARRRDSTRNEKHGQRNPHRSQEYRDGRGTGGEIEIQSFARRQDDGGETDRRRRANQRNRGCAAAEPEQPDENHADGQPEQRAQRDGGDHLRPAHAARTHEQS